MFLSTQPHIDAVERALTTHKKPTGGYAPKYPDLFSPDLAELFGYIVQCGTISTKTKELNFADCYRFPKMVERIQIIYANCWPERPLRTNNRGFPRICGKRNITFVMSVMCGLQNIQPGYERTPEFIFNTYTQCTQLCSRAVIRAWLKGLLGSAPKYWQLIENSNQTYYNGIRVFFRSGQLFEETVMLLKYVLDLKFTSQNGTLVFDEVQLEHLKQTLMLEDPSWWL